MKTAISIPDPLFEAAERLARRLGLSRSELYQRAIARYVEKHASAAVTEQLDRIYGGEDRGDLEPGLAALQRRVVEREDW